MNTDAARLTGFLEQLNNGQAAVVLPELDRLLQQEPQHPGLLALRAEALRLTGQLGPAILAYIKAGQSGAGARVWLTAGAMLADERKTDEALTCLYKAHETAPDDDEVLDRLLTTLFNAERSHEGLDLARRQLALSRNGQFLANAALSLQHNGAYEEASDAFKKIVDIGSDSPTLLGSALVPARFTCDWDWIESLQHKINAWYAQGDFAAPREFPLTHITWCADEARNFGVTRAFVERTQPVVEPVAHPSTRRAAGGRIRVGYLSSDFRNHATMHLMAGLLECHDRTRFEIFAYDYSRPEVSIYRQRFLDAVEHHVEVQTLNDKQVAARIAEDQLDVLFDLKGYTGGGRGAIMAYRPAPLQVAYLGFPGSTATPDIDYIISDRFVTPDSSAPYYTERFCRLPHSYQCNDRKRPVAADPGTRTAHGLPEHRVVFAAFNQSYKIDRGSFAVWLRILQAVPDSVLWVLGNSQAANANLSRQARLAGVDEARLIFAPFAMPEAHLSRLQLADAMLDALVCNGHTTTSDALWAGVPVVTAKGTHFASRVSESLLNAIDLPELVGADHSDMVRIATRIGNDAEHRIALRQRVAQNRLHSPLFDTVRFTRNFETAIEMMVEAQRAGQIPGPIDVPDHGATGSEGSEASPLNSAAALLQTPYPACPLCDGPSKTVHFADCSAHPLWHAPLPKTLEWMQCPSCGHVHSRHYWTAAGQAELTRGVHAELAPDPAMNAADRSESQRTAWVPVVDRVVKLLGGCRENIKPHHRPVWIDLKCGDGSLMTTAADYGFGVVGLDASSETIGRVAPLGLNAKPYEFMGLKFDLTADVLSMSGVLQCTPSPQAALRKAAGILRPGGVLVLAVPDRHSSRWKMMDQTRTNPYWSDLTLYHHFERDRLLALLETCGFELADFTLSNRHKAEMELYAIRKVAP
jgi:protein O-GlcNAc transferase